MIAGWTASRRVRRALSGAGRLLIGGLLSVAMTQPVAAQRPTVRPTTQPPAGGRGGAQPDGKNPQDSTRQLSKDRPVFAFTAPDSTTRELLDKEGYRRVLYQGDTVRFDALAKVLTLKGKPSGVQRDETMLVGDSIIYNDSTKKVVAMGDTVLLRDPTQQDADDFVAGGKIEYDLEAKQGITGPFSTSVVSGQRLYLTAKRSTILADTLVSGRHLVYAKNGSFTYCDHTEPHFHFTTRDMKFVSENVMVARPGILYIGEVPVFWIPFFFQDVRSGRRSGMLTPNFGVAELFRNSPSYRRSISNIGYFFAINDYMNAEASFDWRSGARATATDPGYLRGNAEIRYKVLDRFVNGELAYSYQNLRNGTTNSSWTLNHNQDFSRNTRLTAQLNWVQNTQVQRNTAINAAQALGTIRSQLNYQTKIGPAQIGVGGSRVQYPGRTQVDQDFPSVSVTTGTLEAGPVSWTPSLRFGLQTNSKMDQNLQFPFVYKTSSTGGIDSTRINASKRSMTFNFDTPIKIWDFQWQNSFAITDRLSDYPEQRIVYGVRDSSQHVTRVYDRIYQTNVDWTTSFNLPRFFQGTWNVAPTISVANVDGEGGLFVRSQFSGGKFVSQPKRLSYSVGVSPTLYAMLPGLGPVAKLRHSISPGISWSYSPKATVSDEFLQALNRSRVGYLGALAQNRVSLSLATNLEAKLRAPADSAPESGKKIKLLSLNFSSLTYDFVRADTANGFTDKMFNIAGRTDLLPGFDFRTTYDLFQGDPMSDTATFSPYRTDFGATFSLDSKSAVFAFIGRMLGKKTAIPVDSAVDSLSTTRGERPLGDQNVARQSRSMNVAGGANMRGTQLSLPSGGGWRLGITYNAARQRRPRGGTQIVNDPAKLCESQKVLGLLAYDTCVQRAISAPATGLSTGQSQPGAPVYISPPTQNVSANLSFNITPNWAAQWSTQYDVVRSRFSSQQVGLQRALHDWNAVFAFSQTPNGNFAFNFYIALKAQPELKFNYDRQTYRGSSY